MLKSEDINLKEFLDHQVEKFNSSDFISDDPISIPHRFLKKQDIEIAGFLTATLAWGNRKSILSSAGRLMGTMNNAPYDFIVNAKPADFKPFLKFVHRTFNGDDCLYFLSALQNIYREYSSLEPLFYFMNPNGAAHGIHQFREAFLQTEHLKRSEKHLADPLAGSAAKRINMFLRWMVRNDDRGVDFGLWKTISPANLICPLDVHSGNVARRLGLLSRQQNDWKAAEELTALLRLMDPADPVKYDFALFGLGATGKQTGGQKGRGVK